MYVRDLRESFSTATSWIYTRLEATTQTVCESFGISRSTPSTPKATESSTCSTLPSRETSSATSSTATTRIATGESWSVATATNMVKLSDHLTKLSGWLTVVIECTTTGSKTSSDWESISKLLTESTLLSTSQRNILTNFREALSWDTPIGSRVTSLVEEVLGISVSSDRWTRRVSIMSRGRRGTLGLSRSDWLILTIMATSSSAQFKSTMDGLSATDVFTESMIPVNLPITHTLRGLA